MINNFKPSSKTNLKSKKMLKKLLNTFGTVLGATLQKIGINKLAGLLLPAVISYLN